MRRRSLLTHTFRGVNCIEACALAICLLASCGPKPGTPSPDEMSTAVAALAYTFQTRTAAAPSSTPTDTATPLPSPTASATPDWTATPEHTKPITVKFASCFYGPGPAFTLESNINKGERVELLGMGSQAGWYVIRNPYFHKPCWIAAGDIEVDPGVNTAALPIMTPGAPLP